MFSLAFHRSSADRKLSSKWEGSFRPDQKQDLVSTLLPLPKTSNLPQEWGQTGQRQEPMAVVKEGIGGAWGECRIKEKKKGGLMGGKGTQGHCPRVFPRGGVHGTTCNSKRSLQIHERKLEKHPTRWETLLSLSPLSYGVSVDSQTTHQSKCFTKYPTGGWVDLLTFFWAVSPFLS